MALYAFDGTWNKDRPGSKEDTNVVKFAGAYLPQASVCYIEGVGTRFGPAGRVFGGIMGAGGRSRVKEAWKKLLENFDQGDRIIDIVGFSRGAALALEFAERVGAKEIKGHPGRPPIRFLGLWDTVHSFGIPGNDLNLGWRMDLPDNVTKCFHAMALDERRHTFPVTRLAARIPAADQEGRLYEVWFRGVHSDVGGGNRNQKLSDVALHWMFRGAGRCGLALAAASVERARRERDPEARISVHAIDPVKNRFRVVRWNDQVHISVRPRADEGKREHNNPPAGLQVVDDEGAVQPAGFGQEPVSAPA